MSPLLIAILAASIVGTAFLSGIFGMAGGMILIGILLALLPVPAAMALHAVTQLASNGWRAFLWRRHIVWTPVASYAAGGIAALGAWSLTQYVPSAPVALLMLGVSPFMTRLVPARYKPDPDSRPQAALYGAICITMMLLTGVAGPLLDTFFLGGTRFTRQQIVATKSTCQIIGHALKLAYFGGIVEQAAGVDPVVALIAVVCAMSGTTLARRVLEGMSDTTYRRWAGRIVTAIACFYIAEGGYLLLARAIS